MDDSSKFYTILDLAPGASVEEIKAAYVDLVKVWHPDRFHGESSRLRERAEQKLKQINEAYSRLRAVASSSPGASADPSMPLVVDLFATSFGDRWGYTDRNGKLVIPAVFETAEQFSEGLACVSECGRYGFINGNGQYLVHPQYTKARSFSGGRAAVVFSTKWGYIDHNDRYVVHPNYDDCGDFSEGRAAVLWRGRWGYIDKEGRFAVNPRFQEARKFVEGSAAVRFGDQWGTVNLAGEIYFSGKRAELPPSAD
jgi:hypothetical protein